jgi:predicted secreted protein
MTWVSIAALYFILWWLVLFATLPFGLKTQDEEEDVTLGTVSSAPKGPHMLRAFVRTTIVSALILGGFYLLTKGLGLSVDDIPRIVPDFKSDGTSST